MKMKDLLTEQGFDYEGNELAPLADKVAQTILSRAVAFQKTEESDANPGDILMEQFELFSNMVMERIERMS